MSTPIDHVAHPLSPFLASTVALQATGTVSMTVQVIGYNADDAGGTHLSAALTKARQEQRFRVT